LPLELHQAPNLGAVHPNVGFDVNGRSMDGGEVDAEELGAAIEWGSDRPGEGLVMGFPGVHVG
jgi:hypothetical protein